MASDQLFRQTWINVYWAMENAERPEKWDFDPLDWLKSHSLNNDFRDLLINEISKILLHD